MSSPPVNGRLVVALVLAIVIAGAWLAVTHRDQLGWDRHVASTIHTGG